MYTDSKRHSTRFSKITLTRASRKTPCDITVVKKKNRSKCQWPKLHGVLIQSVHHIRNDHKKVWLRKRHGVLLMWLFSIMRLKKNHRKASGDWVTKFKNIRGNHFYVNKCKMTHENTILTLQTNRITAPTWLLLLKSFIDIIHGYIKISTQTSDTTAE